MSAEIVVTPSTRKSHGGSVDAVHLHERQYEAAHARIDVHRRADGSGECGQLGDRIDHTLRILRRRTDDEHRVLVHERRHRVDVGLPVGVDGHLARGDIEVVRGLVERRVRTGRDHHVRFGDSSLGAGALPRGLHGHQDALRATGRHEAGRALRRVEQRRSRADHLRLDLAEARERQGVERVLVQEELGRRVRDLLHAGSAVVHHPERPAVLPAHVAGSLRLQGSNDVFCGHAVCGKGHGADARGDRFLLVTGERAKRNPEP